MRPEIGKVLWLLLHAYAGFYPVKADEEAQANAKKWLEVFSELVKENSGRCPCHHKWQQLVKVCPPDLSGRADFYLWTMVVHDYINRELGKELQRKKFTLLHPLLAA